MTRLFGKQTGVAKPAARDDSARRARRGSGRRVLVVEDNADAAGAMAELLRLNGHVCWVAADGIEALRLFDEREPEAVVLDLGLPGMDGLEVAARIRQKQAGHHALLIALTGHGGEATIKAAREAGFDHHLLKPADPAVIGTLLANMERR